MDVKKFNLKGLTPQSVTTVIVTGIAIVNMIARVAGFQQVLIPDDQVYDLVSSLFLIISSAYAIYKNFNITPASQKMQEVLELTKEGTILIEDIDRLIKESRENKN